MRWVFVVALLFVAFMGNSALGQTKPRTDAYPLHHGKTAALSSRGPRVSELQYLLRDPRPKQNAWTHVRGTLKPCRRGINHTCYRGVYDLPTAKGVIAWKFRLGFPARGQCDAKVSEWRQTKVTRWFINLIRTGKGRPYCWVAIAAKRLAKAESGGATPGALKLTKFELGQVGVYEPLAYYRYNYYFGLGYGLPWCAIFQNYSLRHVGLPMIDAVNPFYVPSIIEAGMYHRGGASLQAVARPGEMVLYYGDISHIGYVFKVYPKTGYYWTFEGNYANHVAQVLHSPYDHLHYFYVDPWLVNR